MVDPYSNRGPITTKSDIWALGVLLYKVRVNVNYFCINRRATTDFQRYSIDRHVSTPHHLENQYLLFNQPI